MVNMLESNCFKKDISRNFNVDNENISEEILRKVLKVTWKKKGFNGELNDYDIEELKLLENLKECTLMEFVISKKDVDNLNSLPSLNFVYFDFCEFDLEQLDFDKHIETLIFNVCKNLEERKLKNSNAQKIKIVSSRRNVMEIDILNFEKLSFVEELSLNNCYVKNIKNILNVAPNIKYLNLDGSKVENSEELEGLNIIISKEIEYHRANV